MFDERDTCSMISFTSLLQLKPQLSAKLRIRGNVVLGEQYGYFVDDSALCSVRLIKNESSRILEDVVAICHVGSEWGIDSMLVLNSLGGLVHVNVRDGNIELIEHVHLLDDPDSDRGLLWWNRRGGKLQDVSIDYFSHQSLITLKATGIVKIYAFDYDTTQIETEKFEGQEQRIPEAKLILRENIESESLIAFWSFQSSIYTIVSGSSSSLITLKLPTNSDGNAITNDEENNTDNKDGANITRVRLASRHQSWITALSNTGGISPVHASGDTSGKLILWHLDNTDNVRPLKYLLGDNRVCRGFKIDFIWVDYGDRSVWCGDSSGSLTCCRFHLKSATHRTIFPTKRFSLFSMGALFSHLSFQSTLNGVINEFRLRCYSETHGVAVELIYPRSVEAAFRVCHEPSQDIASAQSLSRGTLQGDVISDALESRTSTFRTSGTSSTLVEACCMLPMLHILITTDARSKLMSLWDVNSGSILHTILLSDGFCKSIAGTSVGMTPDSYVKDNEDSLFVENLTARIVVGHANGYFSVFVVQGSKVTVENNDDQLNSSRDEMANGVDSGTDRGKEEIDILDIINEPSTPMQSQLYFGIGDSHATSEESKHNIRGTSQKFASRAFDEADIKNFELEEDRESTLHYEANFFLPPQPHGNVQRHQFTHRLEYRTSVTANAVSDVMISSAGGYAAACYLRKLLVVYKVSEEDKYKLVLKIRFAQQCDEIRSICASPTTNDESIVDDSLLLLMNTRGRIKLMDALRGTVLKEFSINIAPPLQNEQQIQYPAVLGGWYHPTEDTDIHGLFAFDGMHVGLYSIGVNNTTEWLRLHDQHAIVASNQAVARDPTEAETGSSQRSVRSAPSALHVNGGRLFTDLDNAVMGISLPDSSITAPLAVVWSMRRLLTARVTFANEDDGGRDSPSFLNIPVRATAGNVEPPVSRSGADAAGLQETLHILRHQEYCITGNGVRIVYASPLPIHPKVPQHRVLVVLSNGITVVLHM